MEDTKRTTIIARILAVLVATAGAYFIYIILASLPKILSSPNNNFTIIFLFVFPLPMLAFGCYCIYSSYRLWFKISLENIRRISFDTAIIISFLFISFLKFMLKSKDTEYFLMPLLMIVAGIFYLLFNRLLTGLFNMSAATDWAQREKSAKRYFGWFAFFLWSSAINLLQIYLLPEKSSSSSLADLLFLPFFIATIALSYAVYKLGVKIALRNKPKESETSPYLPLSPAQR
jgi:hypothetical protein